MGVWSGKERIESAEQRTLEAESEEDQNGSEMENSVVAKGYH